MNITPDTAGAADPQYTLEVAAAFAEAVRVLDHLTRHHEALRYPSDADQLLRHVGTAVSRLPQLLEQVSGWLEAEQAAGRIRMAAGSRFPSPALAADQAGMKLEQAQAYARILQQALDAAAEITSGMAAVREDGIEEGGGNE